MVRWEIFSHLTVKVCRDLERGSAPELHPKKRQNAVSRCFTSVPEILGYDFSPKNGVQNIILVVFAKVLNQIKRE